MRKKHVATPLTAEEMKEKLQGGAIKVVMPKAVVEADGAFGDGADNPDFTSVEFGGVFWFADELGIDGTGKEHHFPGGAGFSFNWVAKNVGFGEIQVKLTHDGMLQVDSEGLGKDFVKKALCYMIDSAKDKSEKTN